MPERPETNAGSILQKDWNRIYAFIWKKYKEGDETYKDDFEKDPKKAVRRIVKELNKMTREPIAYTTLFDVTDQIPRDLTDEQLDAIIKGEAVAFLQVRLCC